MPSGDNDDESKEYGSDESKGELNGYTDGHHSPFGIIGTIAEKTGYTHDYILWHRPWISFLLESVDAPRYVRGERPAVKIETSDQLLSALADENTLVV